MTASLQLKPEEVDELERLRKFADAAPWSVSCVRTRLDGGEPVFQLQAQFGDDTKTFGFILIGQTGEDFHKAYATARLIVAMHRALPALTAERQEMRKEIERLLKESCWKSNRGG